MRILILLKKSKGGVGLANIRLSKALEKLGHKVRVVSREENIHAYSLLDSILKIRRYIKENEKDFDIIYTQDWTLAFPLLFPYPLSSKKHYCNFCGRQPGAARLLQDLVGRIMGRKLMVVADSIKKGFPKATLAYRGIDYDEFRPLNKKRRCIGWVKKNSELIDEEFIKKLSKELKMPYAIAETIPPKKMNGFYNRCRVFISLPPDFAGMNNVWLEAMAAGVPKVIGNDSGLGKQWPYERVKDNKHPFKECANIIRNSKEKDYRAWLKSNHISWENSAKKLTRIFNKSI